MNKRLFKYILSGAFGTLLLAGSSCTANFEEINRPGENITDEEYGRDNFKLQSYFSQMIENVLSPQENSFQMNENLIGDVYGRYMTTANDAWNGSNFSVYNAQNSWIKYPFNDVMQKFTTPWYAVKESTDENSTVWAWAKILRVAAMHRLIDMYGALPYTQVTSESITVPYDDMKTAYHAMLDDLTSAIETLTVYLSSSSDALMPDADVVYKGDMNKWVKFANSLKLRLAMRLRGVEPEYAQQMAEEAVGHSIGVITSNADAPRYPYPGNSPIWKMCTSWGDARAAADIVSYMVGYQDPRLSLYFNSVTFSGFDGTYAGLRSGSTLTSKAWADQYSCPAGEMDDDYLWMTAAEVAFLKAEGALYTWNMGGSTAEALYEEGITLSFDQWGASGASAYMENSTNTPADYSDPSGKLSTSAVSTITVKWENGDTEKSLERIITQKWIAMYPLGQEAWSEYRRTGYPRFFSLAEQPVSYPTLTTVAARIPFNPDEYTNNPNNINSSTVQQLLGGKDDYSTKLYWAK